MVTPDKQWIVFANGAEKESVSDSAKIQEALKSNGCQIDEKQIGKMTLKIFEDSPAISTYIYGMDAGCYSVIDNDNKKFAVPLRIAIRKSKIQFLDPRMLFRILESAIPFYEKFFSTGFPFKKYDTVFCPEFRIRGMENVGLINMTDKYFKPKAECTEFE